MWIKILSERGDKKFNNTNPLIRPPPAWAQTLPFCHVSLFSVQTGLMSRYHGGMWDVRASSTSVVLMPFRDRVHSTFTLPDNVSLITSQVMPIWATADSTFTAPSDDICLQHWMIFASRSGLNGFVAFADFVCSIFCSGTIIKTHTN